MKKSQALSGKIFKTRRMITRSSFHSAQAYLINMTYCYLGNSEETKESMYDVWFTAHFKDVPLTASFLDQFVRSQPFFKPTHPVGFVNATLLEIESTKFDTIDQRLAHLKPTNDGVRILSLK